MTRTKVRLAIIEANRFIERAEALNKSQVAVTYTDDFSTSKESGAVRRTSMDLTRALAELRRYQ
jgi:hypothetical protein